MGASDGQRWNVERGFGCMDRCPRSGGRDAPAIEPHQTLCLGAVILFHVNEVLKFLIQSYQSSSRDC
jgi:hypothetical protein